MSYDLDTSIEGGGLRYDGVAGETLTAYQVVYGAGDGRWYLADADVATSIPLVGLTMGSATAGQKCRILIKGTVQNMAWTWSEGQELYLSQTGGEMTQTAPTLPARTQVVGAAFTSNVIWFEVEPTGLGGGATGCALLEGATAYVGFDECKEPYTNYWLCDGTADDVQINAALTYVTGLGGGSIMLEQETYDITASITFPGNNLSLWGSGEDTLLVLGNGVDGDVILASNRTDIQIHDLAIDGNKGNQTAHCSCISFIGVSDFMVSRVHLYDAWAHGIEMFSSCHDGIVNNVIAETNGDDGITVSEGYNIIIDDCTARNQAGTVSAVSSGIEIEDDSYNITIHECQCYGNKNNEVGGTTHSAGITIHSHTGYEIPNDVTVVGNICYDNMNGIRVAHTTGTGIGDGIIIDGNICEGNDKHGIYIGDSFRCIVSNNTAKNNLNGIILFVLAGSTIEGNIVYSNTLSTLLYSQSNDNVVSSNIIYDNQEDGIEIDASSRNIVIENKIFNNSQEGANLHSGIILSGDSDDNQIIDNKIHGSNQQYGINISAAACNSSVILDNRLLGNNTACINDAGTTTILPEKEWLATYGAGGISLTGDVPLAAITNGQSAAVGFICPDDFQQLVRAYLLVLPNATQAAADWDISSDYGGVGEGPATHSEADAATTYNVTNNQWYDIELVSLGFFANLAVGDRGGIRLLVSTAGHNVSIFALRMEYV